MSYKNQTLKFCRYYRGEKENPFEGKDPDKAMLWGYEQMWAERAERGLSPADTELLETYEAYGLKSFNADDGVPLSYKAFLFGRFMHWCGGNGLEIDRVEFQKFYDRCYPAK